MERLYCLDFGLLHNIETKHIETKQMKEEKMSPLKDADNVYVKYLVEGETLMVRTVLSSSFIRCKTFSHQYQH